MSEIFGVRDVERSTILKDYISYIIFSGLKSSFINVNMLISSLLYIMYFGRILIENGLW